VSAHKPRWAPLLVRYCAWMPKPSLAPESWFRATTERPWPAAITVEGRHRQYTGFVHTGGALDRGTVSRGARLPSVADGRRRHLMQGGGGLRGHSIRVGRQRLVQNAADGSHGSGMVEHSAQS